MVARTLIAFGVLIASAAAALRNYCITRVEQTGTYLCIPEDSEKLPDSTLAKKSSGGCAQKYLRSSKSIRDRIVSLTDVERALSSSGEQPTPSLVEKATTAISNAGHVAKAQASKTGSAIENPWHCMTSLFKECDK